MRISEGKFAGAVSPKKKRYEFLKKGIRNSQYIKIDYIRNTA
jgi:hypothetical protein